MSDLYLFHKPYQVLCQFTDNSPPSSGKRKTLADYIQVPDIYPAGRLDYDSEGLLLLTSDGGLAHHITHPKHKEVKRYWVQVEGIPDEASLDKLRQGVTLKDGATRPAEVKAIPVPDIPERHPPVRFRANIPTQWLEIGISEGRNRQVRRMTAHIGYPTLRLIRISIGSWELGDLAEGDYELKTVQAPSSSSSNTNSHRRNSRPSSRRAKDTTRRNRFSHKQTKR